MKKNNHISKEKSASNKIVFITIGTILMLYAITIFAVLLWGLLSSLKSDIDFTIYRNVAKLPDLKWSKNEFLKISNYTKVFQNFELRTEVSYFIGNKPVGHESTDGIASMLFNTFVYAVVGAALQTIVPAVIAYLCAKYPKAFSSFLYALVLTTMTIPVVGNIPATISVLRALGLYDTYIGMIVMKFSFGGMYFIMFHATFSAMPDTYAEAAEIDGASQLRVLVSIILPLAIKMLTTVFLIQFVHFWNDYQMALIYMPTHPTLAYGVYYLTIGTNKGEFAFIPAKTAACMMLAIPILIIFVLFKDKLMGNVSLGGIKG